MKLLTLLLLLTFNAYAESETIRFSEVSMKGTACQTGTFDTVFAPDQSILSILFDEFVSELPNEEGTRADKNKNIKVCTIKFSAIIPKGYKVTNMDLSYDVRGALVLDQGVSAKFESTLLERGGFLNAGRGRVNKKLIYKMWMGEKDEDIFLDKNVQFKDLTKCTTKEEKVTFKLRNTSTLYMHQHHLALGSFGYFAIDTSDVAGQMNVVLNLEKCSDQNNNSTANRYLRVKRICENRGGRFIGGRCILPNRDRTTRTRSPRR